MSKNSTVSKIARCPFRLQFLEKPARKKQQNVCVFVKKSDTNNYGNKLQQRGRAEQRNVYRESELQTSKRKREQEREGG